MNEYLTPLDVAALLQVSRITVYRWIKSRKLKMHKIGGVVRIKKEELKEFIENPQ